MNPNRIMIEILSESKFNSNLFKLQIQVKPKSIPNFNLFRIESESISNTNQIQLQSYANFKISEIQSKFCKIQS